MIRYISVLALFSLFTSVLTAQPTAGLVRYFSFDDCLALGQDGGNTGIDAILQNGPACACGVRGRGIEFDGIDDAMIIPSTESIFNTIDFSISFYYKSVFGGSQDLISRKEFCDPDHAFSIRVIPGSNTIITQMEENVSKGTLWNTQLDQTNCWHHVVFIRKDKFHQLFLDGVLVEEESTVKRTDISNPNIQLEVSSGPCLGIQDLGFRGTLDELRIYNRALNESEISELAHPIDEILTQDTLIFLGGSIDILSSPSCNNSFSWFPTQGVDMVADPNTTITPDQTTVYTLSNAQENCISTDSIRISVIDPSVLDCTELFMANGFTPNGDGNNDTYGISNPFALEEFVSIEIIDKWGNRVYYSADKFAKWDGTFQGSSLNPGVFLYRILYRCNGEDQYRSGSVTLLK